MKIAIVGAGGVGGFLGAVLARAGHSVTLLARPAHVAAIKERGLQLESRQFGNFTASVAATDEAARLGRNDLVFITVKMYDFQEACRTAETALAEDGFAVTIQNGLDATDMLASTIGAQRTLTGTIAIEATLERPGLVTHTTPLHILTLAHASGAPSERLVQLQTALADAGLNVQLAESGRRALWDKACVLIPFASLTAAGDCTLGDIYGIPALKLVWSALCDEATAVAQADGYDVRATLDAMLARFAGMASTAPGFTSSMNRDIRTGRRSELEWLTGKMIRLGAEKGVPVPEHAALYGLLTLKEARSRTSDGKTAIA